MKKWMGLVCVVFLMMVFVSSVKPQVAGEIASPALRMDAGYGKIPLQFIPNEGQVDGNVAYYVTGRDKTIYFTSEGLTYVLSGRRASKADESRWTHLRPDAPTEAVPSERWVVKQDFLGANPDVVPVSLEDSGAVISYFRGKPESWKAGLSASSKIVYRELWPGIDLVYYGTVDRMKYEFIVHPGADPSSIRLAYRGAQSVDLTEDGRLEVQTPAGGFEDDVPVAWQEPDDGRTDVQVAFALQDVPGDEDSWSRNHVYGFELGDYDRNLTLVLDPAVLVYCGFIGGSGGDNAYGIAVDSSGHAYITGYTASTETSFPVVGGPDQTYNGGDFDAFVVKVNAEGTALGYCGFIGGSGDDRGYGIVVDGLGNAYITGSTNSDETTFPVVIGPDLTANGGTDAFVAKLDASGAELEYCGYIGGMVHDYGRGIAIDDSGNAYVTGFTTSGSTFPLVVGPDLTANGWTDTFVTKVNAQGTALVYSGFIGGSGDDWGYGIAVDAAGNAYVTGVTDSTQTTFPVKVGPDLTYNGGLYDAFVAKVNAAGTGLDYCGYIGGSNLDLGYGIAVDGSGNAYVTGYTDSTQTTFPVKVGPDLTYNGNSDVFVAKVNAAGTGLDYCGYIGGSQVEYGLGIAVDGDGNACVTGRTQSTYPSFPFVEGPEWRHKGGDDAFVAKVNAAGTGLIHCGYIGGSGGDVGNGIAVDGSGNVYVVGNTNSNEATFPVVVGPDLTYNFGSDAFVAKVALAYTISGTVTYESSGLENVVMAGLPDEPVTNASGNYTATVIKGWSGTATPTLAGYTFDPISRTYANVTTNQAAQDYVAALIVQTPPAIGLSRDNLHFGYEIGKTPPGAQQVLITNTGGGTLEWTAAANSWLGVVPAAGTGDAMMAVSVDATGLPAGTYTSQVTIEAAGATNSPQMIDVTLNVIAAGASSPPFGYFDTPTDGAVVAGAVPVTGWALDDVEVVGVDIKRSPHATDDPAAIGPDGLVYIGDAVFVEGARPDIEAAYPDYPLNYRAGWGYMLLSNMLPGQGNGNFTLHAFAVDTDGARVKLGEKTITADNASSVLPFGTIDTPESVGAASGAAFYNFGWVLTPQPNMIPIDGSTIWVFVDGLPLGNPSYNHYREDIATLFPGLKNTDGAVGVYTLDTTAYANGVHTIAWGVTDDAGNAAGIGSRYFMVQNMGRAEIEGAAVAAGPSGVRRPLSEIGHILTAFHEPVYVSKGYDVERRPEMMPTGADGAVEIAIAEVERVELVLGWEAMERAVESGRWSGRSSGGRLSYKGYLVAGDELRPLPIGSTLDPRTGVFAWLPGPGFLGEYMFVFVRERSGGIQDKSVVRITIKPKF